MSRLLRVSVLLGMFVLPILPSVSAQEPAQPTFRNQTDLVQLDVAVLDRQRTPVVGLAMDDFVVLEDGKERPIVAFVPVVLPPPRAAVGVSAPWTRDVAEDLVTNAMAPEGRLVVIMMDRTIRSGDVQSARRIALAAIDAMSAGDRAAIVFVSQFSNAGRSVDFTSDKARLRAAILAPFAVAAHAPPGTSNNENHVMLDDPDGWESGDCHCGVCVLESLERVAVALRDVPGRRKTVLLISTYNRVAESMQESGWGSIVRGTGLCGQPLKTARGRMLTAVSAANVQIHTLDPAGLEAPGPVGTSPLGGSLGGIKRRQARLRELPELTGGRLVSNTNTPEALVPAVMNESSAYYLIGFEALDPSPARPHRIEVKVRRRGLTVQTRREYGALPMDSGAAPAADRTPATSAISGVLPKGGLSLGMTLAAFATADVGKSLVTVALRVQRPEGDPLWETFNGNRRVDVVVAAFDRLGHSVAVARQHADLSALTPAAPGFDLLSYLKLDPGHYDVRAAVSTAGDDVVGSVHTTTDVPDFGKHRPGLSPIVLSNHRAESGLPADIASFVPAAPVAERTFGGASSVSASVRVYADGRQSDSPASVSTTIVDRSGRTVFERSTPVVLRPFGTGRIGDYSIDLPLRELSPGEYLLSMRLGDTPVASSHVRFTVR